MSLLSKSFDSSVLMCVKSSQYIYWHQRFSMAANILKNAATHILTPETGAFQHSSFVAGGIVTSAGLISVKQGIIHTLSPLSGHYRFLFSLSVSDTGQLCLQ